MKDPRLARITHIEVLGLSPRIDALYAAALRDSGALIWRTLVRCGVPPRPRREAELLGVTLAGALATAGRYWMQTGYRGSLDSVNSSAVKVLLGTAAALR